MVDKQKRGRPPGITGFKFTSLQSVECRKAIFNASIPIIYIRNERFYTLKTICWLTNRNIRAVSAWVDRGCISAKTYIGKTGLFSEDEVEKLLNTGQLNERIPYDHR